MSSPARRSSTSEPPSDDAILDAARAQLLEVGWKRATLTDIARRAGVSRMTIYRRWSDVRELMGDLMTREWTDVGSSIIASAHPAQRDLHRQDVVTALVRVATSMRASDLFQRIVDVDPEMLLPYLTQRRGRTQQVLLDVLREAIATAQAGGSVRAGDPDRLAAAIVLACHGYVVSSRTFDDVASQDEFDEDLRLLVDRFLTP